MTGVNPGKHNIYDFLARNTSNYLPFLSSAEIKGPKRHIKIGKYSIPFGKTEIKAMRKGTPFWHWLGKAGIFSSVIRVPVTFPPEKFQGVLLSGMCVPDLKGSQGGVLPLHDPHRGRRIPRRRRSRRHRAQNGACHPACRGQTSARRKAGTELRVHYGIRPDVAANQARLTVGSEKFTLKVGEYSEWIPIEFKAGMGFNAHGICRFYLKEISPEVEVYVTPVNIDPGHPDLPISHPVTYSIYLAKLYGAFATLGLAEDTWALNEARPRRRRLPRASLRQSSETASACYLMRSTGLGRASAPASSIPPTACSTCSGATSKKIIRAARDVPKAERREVIQDLYRAHGQPDRPRQWERSTTTLLMVISDHGFKSFARCMNLNAWLHSERILSLSEDGKTESGDWFEDVDWSRTPALTHGSQWPLSEYQGPEKQGIVDPAQAQALQEEIKQKLNGLVDPASGAIGITGRLSAPNVVYRGPYRDNAPDLLIRLWRRLSSFMGFSNGQSNDEDFRRRTTKAWSRRSLHRSEASAWECSSQATNSSKRSPQS